MLVGRRDVFVTTPLPTLPDITGSSRAPIYLGPRIYKGCTHLAGAPAPEMFEKAPRKTVLQRNYKKPINREREYIYKC